MFRGVDGAGFIARITMIIMGSYHMLRQSVVTIKRPMGQRALVHKKWVSVLSPNS